MPGDSTALSSEPNRHPHEARCRSTCPVCSGSLIHLRDAMRCARCSYTFCEDCDGGTTDQPMLFGD